MRVCIPFLSFPLTPSPLEWRLPYSLLVLLRKHLSSLFSLLSVCVFMSEWESVKVRKKKKEQNIRGGFGFRFISWSRCTDSVLQSINQSENKKHPSCCIKSSPPYPNRGVVELYSSFPLSLFLSLKAQLLRPCRPYRAQACQAWTIRHL